MNEQNKPEMKPLNAGDAFKVLRVTGKSGMVMPLHRSTKEAVIIVQKGAAVLSIRGKEFRLEKGDNFIIPAQESHQLRLEADFEAIAIMTLDSNIEFIEKQL